MRWWSSKPHLVTAQTLDSADFLWLHFYLALPPHNFSYLFLDRSLRLCLPPDLTPISPHISSVDAASLYLFATASPPPSCLGIWKSRDILVFRNLVQKIKNIYYWRNILMKDRLMQASFVTFCDISYKRNIYWFAFPRHILKITSLKLSLRECLWTFVWCANFQVRLKVL